MHRRKSTPESNGVFHVAQVFDELSLNMNDDRTDTERIFTTSA